MSFSLRTDLGLQHLFASAIRNQAMVPHEAHFVVMNRHHQYFKAGMPAIQPATASLQRGAAEQQHLAVGFMYFAAVLLREQLIPVEAGKPLRITAQCSREGGVNRSNLPVGPYPRHSTLDVLDRHGPTVDFVFERILLGYYSAQGDHQKYRQAKKIHPKLGTPESQLAGTVNK